MGSITCIAWKGDTLVLGDMDGNLNFWDLKGRVSRYVARMQSYYLVKKKVTSVDRILLEACELVSVVTEWLSVGWALGSLVKELGGRAS